MDCWHPLSGANPITRVAGQRSRSDPEITTMRVFAGGACGAERTVVSGRAVGEDEASTDPDRPVGDHRRTGACRWPTAACGKVGARRLSAWKRRGVPANLAGDQQGDERRDGGNGHEGYNGESDDETAAPLHRMAGVPIVLGVHAPPHSSSDPGGGSSRRQPASYPLMIGRSTARLDSR